MSFASTIAELTQQQGRDAAEARRDAARIAAQAMTSNAEAASRAAGAKGVIWGNAISNISNSIAQIPQEINRGKMIDLQRQEMESQVAERKAQTEKIQQQQAENQAVDRAFQESIDPATGLVDQNKAMAKLPGSVWSKYQPVFDAHNKSVEAVQKAKDEQASELFYNAWRTGDPGVLMAGAKLGSAAFSPEESQQIQQLAGAVAQSPEESQEASVKSLAAHIGQHFKGFQSRVDSHLKEQSAQAHQDATTRAANASAMKTEAEISGTLPPTPAQQELVTLRQAQLKETEAKLAGTLPMTEKDKAELEIQREGLKVRKQGQAQSAASSQPVRVEHKGPDGKTIIEYIPKNQLAGRSFEKGAGATTEGRIASATAVNQTGNDIIADLSNPAFASKIGPIMGRASSLRDLIGSPPPEFSELAGKIESYALANMGVHGMRSVQGANEVKKLLDQKHTPESLIAAIKGLNQFSAHFIENQGRTVPEAPKETAGPPVGTVRTYNGETRKWTGSEWVLK